MYSQLSKSIFAPLSVVYLQIPFLLLYCCCQAFCFYVYFKPFEKLFLKLLKLIKTLFLKTIFIYNSHKLLFDVYAHISRLPCSLSSFTLKDTILFNLCLLVISILVFLVFFLTWNGPLFHMYSWCGYRTLTWQLCSFILRHSVDSWLLFFLMKTFLWVLTVGLL